VHARRFLITLVSLSVVAVGAVGLTPIASADPLCPAVDPVTHVVTPAPTLPLDWTGCQLMGADLSGANLTEAELGGADLSGADLSGADLTRAYLGGAEITNARLKSAKLVGASFTSADLTGSDLGGADFTGADLAIAGLRDTNLTGVNLSRADLSGADFAGAYVTCSDSGTLGTGILNTASNLPAGWTLSGGVLSVPIVPCNPKPLWMQSIGRASVTDSCPIGTNPSWAMWPNNGSGGYVCDRLIAA
jgi:hypothetical protein